VGGEKNGKARTPSQTRGGGKNLGERGTFHSGTREFLSILEGGRGPYFTARGVTNLRKGGELKKELTPQRKKKKESYSKITWDKKILKKKRVLPDGKEKKPAGACGRIRGHGKEKGTGVNLGKRNHEIPTDWKKRGKKSLKKQDLIRSFTSGNEGYTFFPKGEERRSRYLLQAKKKEGPGHCPKPRQSFSGGGGGFRPCQKRAEREKKSE